ncbi:hypothetical protein RND81_06G207200 [Saponaria officinalis]|uniref:Uncharacterized protein n=1 Tax=Saponaria officinalis TaxID=3572 RepID=A0AAW1K993_SAPOF
MIPWLMICCLGHVLYHFILGLIQLKTILTNSFRLGEEVNLVFSFSIHSLPKPVFHVLTWYRSLCVALNRRSHIFMLTVDRFKSAKELCKENERSSISLIQGGVVNY